MIFKAEVVRQEGKDPKDNPRFVITNLKQNPQWIYEQVYCERGDIENRIKELHHGLEIDRTLKARAVQHIEFALPRPFMNNAG